MLEANVRRGRAGMRHGPVARRACSGAVLRSAPSDNPAAKITQPPPRPAPTPAAVHATTRLDEDIAADVARRARVIRKPSARSGGVHVGERPRVAPRRVDLLAHVAQPVSVQ